MTQNRFPNLSMADLRDWALRFPDLREKLEAELAERKIGRPKPRRYQKALENYDLAVKAFENIIKKTDPNILCERLTELEEDSHEAKLIERALEELWAKRREAKKALATDRG